MASSRRTGKRLASSHQISFQNSNCKCYQLSGCTELLISFAWPNFFLVEPTELYQSQKNVLSGESGMVDQCHFLRSDELLEKERLFGKKRNAPLFSFQVFALFHLSKKLHILCKEFCKSLLSYLRYHCMVFCEQ